MAFWDLNFDVVRHFLRVHYDYYQKKNVVVIVNPSHFLRMVRLAKMLEIFFYSKEHVVFIFADEEIEVGKPKRKRESERKCKLV